MVTKKVFVILPDGVSLRNFAYTSFVELGEQVGYEVIFWNHTPFDLSEIGLQEISLNGKPSPKTDLLKRARKEIELKNFEVKTGNSTFRKYSFRPSTKTIKQKTRNFIVKKYSKRFRNNKLKLLRAKLKNFERQTKYYKDCLEVLAVEKPNFVFCTSQRSSVGIAPILAAQELQIPTASFIFSWDNVPKATMVIEPDHYFVWSDYMKRELLYYYPYISENKIHITGTPQFEPHFDSSLFKDRTMFLEENKLPTDKKYVCFSGDDVTTSPHDPDYLKDVAEAVELLNKKGYNLGILFRRCPVDFSDRYDAILKKYRNIIFPLAPKWEKQGGSWNAILPKREDLSLLINTVRHTECIINVGSSMVFDAICHDKPCMYINYNPAVQELKKDIHTIYKYIHFQSMPSKMAVVWLNSAQEISTKIASVLNDTSQSLESAKIWFKKINMHPPQNASKRIWEEIEKICTL